MPSGHRTETCLTCGQQWREGGCELKGLWHVSPTIERLAASLRPPDQPQPLQEHGLK